MAIVAARKISNLRGVDEGMERESHALRENFVFPSLVPASCLLGGPPAELYGLSSWWPRTPG
jgi:hypothetical protein